MTTLAQAHLPQPSNLLAQINKVIENPNIQEPLRTSISLYLSGLGELKALAVLVSAFFIASAIFFAVKTGWLALRVDRVNDIILKTNLPKKRSIKAWRQIERHFFAGDENDLKLALIESDALLDEALRLAGFRGTDLGDRLKKITSAQITNLNEIWEAHKLRNRLVHEAGFKLNRDIAERALTVYKKTLQDIGILD